MPIVFDRESAVANPPLITIGNTHRRKSYWTNRQRRTKVVNIRLRSAMVAIPRQNWVGQPCADSNRVPPMTLVEQLRSKKKALTVEELADILCIAIRTLYKEVEDDHIPFFRVRTSIRFDPHQIADWLEGKMPSYSVRPPDRSDTGLRA